MTNILACACDNLLCHNNSVFASIRDTNHTQKQTDSSVTPEYTKHAELAFNGVQCLVYDKAMLSFLFREYSLIQLTEKLFRYIPNSNSKYASFKVSERKH